MVSYSGILKDQLDVEEVAVAVEAAVKGQVAAVLVELEKA
jgi:hypothetical protein